MSALLAAARELEELRARVAQLEADFRALRSARAGDPPRTMYKSSEVATMLGCCDQTVRNMIADGRLEAEDMGGWYAITPAAVAAVRGKRRAVAS